MKWLALPLIIALSIPVTLLGGVVVADYWQWFITPTFGFTPITYLQAVGLVMTVGLFKIGLATTDYKTDNDAPIATAFVSLAGYLFAWLISWGIGFIWSLFI